MAIAMSIEKERNAKKASHKERETEDLLPYLLSLEAGKEKVLLPHLLFLEAGKEGEAGEEGLEVILL